MSTMVMNPTVVALPRLRLTPLDTFSYVSVAPGQSLWQVAETLAPEADPREVIADIMALNQLASSAVEPGQKLAIPTAYAP